MATTVKCRTSTKPARCGTLQFYQSVVDGNVENDTVRRSVDGALATILGREADLRRGKVSMAGARREETAQST